MKQMKGQIALVVLVVSSIVLTLGLSLSRKAVVETKIDTDEELLKTAFNTAESGIDYYLATGQTNYQTSDLLSQATVTAENIGLTSVLVSDGMTLQNENSYFWMVGHNEADGKLDYGSVYGGASVKICADNTYNGLVYVVYFYRQGAEYKTRRAGYSLGGALPGDTKGFVTPGGGVSGCSDSSKEGFTFNLGGTPLLLVVSPMTGGTNLRIEGSAIFPIQGKDISSVGQAGDVSAQAVKRKISVKKIYEVPAFMLEGITADGVVNN
jgi:hypothetical protein